MKLLSNITIYKGIHWINKHCIFPVKSVNEKIRFILIYKYFLIKINL